MSVPVYISEMAPSEHRGFLVSGNVAFITFGQVKQIPRDELENIFILQKKVCGWTRLRRLLRGEARRVEVDAGAGGGAVGDTGVAISRVSK